MIYADIYIFHMYTYLKFNIAILDFALPVSSHLDVQHCHYSYGITGPRKHSYSRRNFVAILFTN